MQQMIHIFKKDLRGLQGEICVFVAVMVLAYLVGRSDFVEYMDLDLYQLLPIIAGCFLTARVMHAEAIPGSAQFWITRPYRWQSLLAAKLLFLLVCIHLPLFAARSIILVAEGFPLLGNLPGLLWSQVLMMVVSMIIAAFAAITPGLGSFILSMVGTIAILGTLLMLADFRVIPTGASLQRLEWVRTSVLAVTLAFAAMVVLYVQYRKRNTPVGRSLLVGLFSLGLLAAAWTPFPFAWAVQSAAAGQGLDSSTIQVRVGMALPEDFPAALSNLRAFEAENDYMFLDIPLVIGGLPLGTEIRSRAAQLTFQSADGRIANPGPSDGYHWGISRWVGGTISNELDETLLPIRVALNSSFFKNTQGQAVTVRGSLYLTVFGNSRAVTLPVAGSPVNVWDSLQCFFPLATRTRPSLIRCRSVLRRPVQSIYVDGSLLMEAASYSPFPADLSLNPIEDGGHRVKLKASAQQAMLIVSEPVGFVRKDFEFSNVRLQDYRPQ